MLLLGALVSCLCLSFGAIAQTPSGFSPAAPLHLPAVFQNNVSVTPAGVLIDRATVLNAPAIFPPSNLTVGSGSYMLFMIDLDVPINSSAPNATRQTLLHWFEPNLVPSATQFVVQNNTGIQGAPYLQPGPPPGSGPHRYTLVLFHQPANFTLPPQYANISPPVNSTFRIGFNITKFVAAAGLGAPVAGNYFQVLNGTAAETASVTATVPAATSTPTAATYTGGAVEFSSGFKNIFPMVALSLVGAAFWML